VDGHYGAVAKSNFVGLRYREPIHRTLRELVLSYFEDYFTEDRRKTLRSYTGLLSLAQFDRLRWTFRDEPLRLISDRLDALVHRPVLTPAMARRLAPVDGRSLQGGMVGTLVEGLYRGSRAR
jgi:AcrR family transcriptional regulator